MGRNVEQPARPTILKRVVRGDLTGKMIFESSSEESKGEGHSSIISGKNISGREINRNKAPKLGSCLAFKKQSRSMCITRAE